MCSTLGAKMASAISLVSSSILLSSSSSPSVYLPISNSVNWVSSSSSYKCISSWVSPKRCRQNLICRAAEYKFPDPIPEFADAVSFLRRRLRLCNLFWFIGSLSFHPFVKKVQIFIGVLGNGEV